MIIMVSTGGPSSPTKHLSDFLKHDVLSLLRNVPTVTPANQVAAFHAVKVQYLNRYGISENDTLGKTSAVSDVRSLLVSPIPNSQVTSQISLPSL